MDVEEFLLNENDLYSQAEFMVQHRDALDRLKSFRMSSKLSSNARLSIRNSILLAKKANLGVAAGQDSRKKDPLDAIEDGNSKLKSTLRFLSTNSS